MGQIPKNNVIKALTGTTLKLKVNGEYKEIPIEKADELMAQKKDALIQSGELRSSDGQGYMEAWNRTKQKALEGEYSIDTAGKDTASDITYKGLEPNTLGTTQKHGQTIVSERSNLGKAFTKKVRRDNPADLEALINRDAFPILGRLALEGDEETAKQTAMDEAKAKVTAEEVQAKASAGEKAKETEMETPPFSTYFASQFGNRKDWLSSMAQLSLPEKESMLKAHLKSIIPHMLQYKSLSQMGTDFLTPFKNEAGEIQYNQGSMTNMYNRLFGGEGRSLIDAVYNTTSANLTPEEQAKQATDTQENKLSWDKGLREGTLTKIDDNTVEVKGTDQVFKSDSSRKFKMRLRRNPSTNEIEREILEYPSSKLEGKPKSFSALPEQQVLNTSRENTPTVYKYTVDKVTNKPLYINVNNPNDMFAAEELQDSNPTYKEGGVLIPKGQSGMLSPSEQLRKLTNKENVPTSAKTTSTPPQSSSNVVTQRTQTKQLPTKKDTETKFKDINWSTSDDLEIASLVAELGGLAASFVPGGSFVSGVSGLGSTGLAMGAEYSRGELGPEDIGKYLTSGLMDLASVVPGLGIAAKVSKLGKYAGKTVNLINKAAKTGLFVGGAEETGRALVGIGEKINKEGFSNLSIQDVKTLLQGLTLIGHGAKAISAPKSVEVKPFEGKETLGVAVPKVGNPIPDVPIIKEGDVWKFKDTDMKDYTIGKRKGEPIGAESTVVNSPYITKSEFDPVTGERRSWASRNLNPFNGLTNAYIEQRGGPGKLYNKDTRIKAFKEAQKRNVVGEEKPVVVEKPLVEEEVPATESNTTIVREEPTPVAVEAPKVVKTPEELAAEKEKIDKLIANRKKLSTFKLDEGKEKAAARVTAARNKRPIPRLGLSEDVIFRKGGKMIPKAEGGDKVVYDWNNPAPLPGPRYSEDELKLMTAKPAVIPSKFGHMQALDIRGKALNPPTSMEKSEKIKGIAQPSKPTIFDTLSKMKINEKGAMDLSEFGRTLFLNRELEKQKPSLYIPQVVDRAETVVPVQGDLLTKSAYYNKAAQTRNIANISRTSDATANFLRNLAGSQQANELEGQGDLAYAQGLDRSKQMQLQAQSANDAARTEAANQRAMYFTKAKATKEEADRAIEGEKASNINTFWASKNMDIKRGTAEKEDAIRNIALQQEIAKAEKAYPKALENYKLYQSDPDNTKYASYKEDYDNFNQMLLNARKVAYNLPIKKLGGSIERNKYNMEMYKEENKFRDDITKVINKWKDKKGDMVHVNAMRTSKEINELVSKIFSK